MARDSVPADGGARPLPLAGWWLRVAAYLLDTVILLCIAMAVFLGVWGTSGEAGTAGIAAAITWATTDYLVRGLVYAPLLMRRRGGHNGQTIGKQVARIRVVREDGWPMSYGAGVLREWLARTLIIQVAGVALTGGVAVLLDYIWPLSDERKQALHDRLASTVVLEARPSSARRRLDTAAPDLLERAPAVVRPGERVHRAMRAMKRNGPTRMRPPKVTTRSV
jgi:uncharacterized RDD family membrane protein YckC